MAKKAVAKAVAKSLVFCLLYNNIRHSFSSCFLLDFEIEMDTVSGMQYGNPARRGGAAAAARYRRRYCTRYP